MDDEAHLFAHAIGDVVGEAPRGRDAPLARPEPGAEEVELAIELPRGHDGRMLRKGTPAFQGPERGRGELVGLLLASERAIAL